MPRTVPPLAPGYGIVPFQPCAPSGILRTDCLSTMDPENSQPLLAHHHSLVDSKAQRGPDGTYKSIREQLVL